MRLHRRQARAIALILEEREILQHEHDEIDKLVARVLDLGEALHLLRAILKQFEQPSTPTAAGNAGQQFDHTDSDADGERRESRRYQEAAAGASVSRSIGS